MDREYSIDIFKGFLVMGMVLVHVMQFFSDGMIYPIIDYFINYGNIITFSGFVFCFGYAVQISYMNKDFKFIWKKLLINILKTLIAFYISGITFKLFIDKSPFVYKTFINVFILKDIPGWSEFLASFACLNLVTLILFLPYKKLMENKKIYWAVFVLLLLTTFIPYENVKINQLGILIGTKNFACFPVIQYMPFYILGMYFKKYNVSFYINYLIGAGALSAVPIFKFITQRKLPNRFPPELEWILMPMLILYLYYLVSKFLEKYYLILKPIIVLGQNALFSIVLSNMIIFTINSKFERLLLTSTQCIYMNLVILAILYYFIKIKVNNGKLPVNMNKSKYLRV
ncbi:hypothetical protein M2651_01440 [Clostridium sp. SYSU_GA19001]|uniref:hypothetical protein n=1 Tax=Clostridium caldaquaticum TaxID=2940653 RepID=UPI0020773803|nr:hypothetical protein [Clostridium caldaquaticum]MCM8709683.1 hypothetical protein [Clostridium caldaquaticum]